MIGSFSKTFQSDGFKNSYNLNRQQSQESSLRGNFVPWEHRRNPITGIQFTQKTRETSNEAMSPRGYEKSAPSSPA